jgi:hypothetical protein
MSSIHFATHKQVSFFFNSQLGIRNSLRLKVVRRRFGKQLGVHWQARGSSESTICRAPGGSDSSQPASRAGRHEHEKDPACAIHRDKQRRTTRRSDPKSLCAGRPFPEVNSLGKTSVPTRLMPTAKYVLAIAALRASIGHMGSDKPPTVAEGLKTISAPFKPNPAQLRG